MILGTLVILVLLLAAGALATLISAAIGAMAITLVSIWVLFAAFCVNFFRDPDPVVPKDPNAIVAPGHGRVDVIDETTELEFMGGACKRISIFLSVFDVHVQQAPVAGRVVHLRHKPGQFLNAMRTDSSSLNENVLIGLESSERPGEKIGVRLIAGLIARRIIPWISSHDLVARGERISLIQFGSRVDLYLPLTSTVQVRLGDRVKGGETIVARRI